MRIVHLIPCLSAAGAEILMANMAVMTAKLGHKVVVCCLFPPHETWMRLPLSKELEKLCKIEVLHIQVRFKFLHKPQLNNENYVRLLNQFKPDVIHSHLYLSELMAYSYIFHGAVYVTHGHDNMHQLNSLKFSSFWKKSNLTNLWERMWLFSQYRKARPLFIAISKDVQIYFGNVLPKNTGKIIHLPNAIDLKKFATYRKYGTSEGRFRLCTIASLVPKKNHTFLIDVVNELRKRNYNIELEIIGTGRLLSALEQKVMNLNLADCIFFRGSVGNVPEFLSNANLYVHPAWYEPFGLVILEAMASGLPVIALDGQGNRDLMKNNVNGFILPVKSSAIEFADKVEFFILNPKELERQGKLSLEFSASYDIESYAKQMIAFYTEHKLL
jgi:glycosyltransferase involved in cell wall biosynthesis